jgi:hypothetical protein
MNGTLDGLFRRHAPAAAVSLASGSASAETTAAPPEQKSAPAR